MSRKFIFRIILAVIVIVAIYRFFANQPEYTLNHVTGQTMGTIRYNVKYLGDDAPNYKTNIDSILAAFNQSLSTYIPDSEISQLNTSGVLVKPTALFLEVLESSKAAFGATDGAFDPTVGPLVNAWGFGPNKKPAILDSNMVDSLLQFVGFEKISVQNENVRMDTSMYLDFSAIAKGYAVDLIGEFLESKGYNHYLVEIGGEVRARGQNEQNETWVIGIEDPTVDMDEQRLLATVRLRDKSMATSGNYRNYYVIDGHTIAHTIDPRTGFNTNHNLLSASVFGKDCMTADAFATAFMVLGLEASMEIIQSSDLEAFLIYQGSDGELKSYVSNGLSKDIGLNKLEE